MKRRHFIKTAIGAAGIGLATGLYTWKVEPYWLEFTRQPIQIRHLPERLQGKLLMQISDIHVGNRFDYQFIINSFAYARKFKPDFVVYTGDFVNYENREQFKQLQKVMEYAVHGKLGTVGILGNHDYGKNWMQDDVAEQITDILGGYGVVMLRNQQHTLAGLNFLGIDDLWGTHFRPYDVMHDYDPSQANLVLCHNPDVCDMDVWNGYEGWILAGHTHGGQVKPPFLEPPLVPVNNKNYVAGAMDLKDGRFLYINRALGCLWPIRFNVRPEISLFTLQKA